MINRVLLVLLLFTVITDDSFSQSDSHGSPWIINGSVVDSLFDFPIEYASAILYRQSDEVSAAGTTTDSDGKFHLETNRPGMCYLEVSFLGYNTKKVGDIFLQRGIKTVDAGKILLVSAVLTTDDVEVSIDKIPLEYQIDKKVINVSQINTAISGTAVDVLQNVPSINVDIEGNVQLRGSANFTVLIDGRPSVLDANEALEQIPASTIDNIEIITNPSAKYDPDGTAGIINIVMKKNQLRGAGGIVNFSGGSFGNLGGDVLLNFKRGIMNASIGGNYSVRKRPGSSKEEKWSIKDDTTTYVNSDGTRDREGEHYGLKAIIELDISPKDNIGLGLRYGGRSHGHDSELDYLEWSDPGTGSFNYVSTSQTERSGDFYAGNLDYSHKFGRKGQLFTGSVQISRREGTEEAANELTDLNGEQISGQISTEDGPGDNVQFNMDYVHPLTDTEKIEAGAQGKMSFSQDITSLTVFDTTTAQYIPQSEFNNDIDYTRDIYSLYTLYSGEKGKFGYQGGLRGEYTYRIVDSSTNGKFKIGRWDYFPTIHTSYEISPKREFMASYSRRIERPRGWYLEPFPTWTDAYNVRQGNPDLKPEYIDSYEIGHQNYIGDYFISIEGYYKITHNMIERIKSVYPEGDNVFLSTIDNVGTGYAGGVEFMTNMEPVRWWNLNFMGNLFNNRVEGTILGQPFSNESFQWNTRINNSFKLRKTTKLQANIQYYSPSVTSQGDVEAFFMFDLALKQEFMKGQLAATLQVNNVFGTAKHEMTSEGADFYTYRYFDRESPSIMLNLNYNINNYKPERKKNGNGNGFEGEDEF